MFEAQLLFAPTTDPGLEVFSPWFPRRGDLVRGTLDVVAIDTATLSVELVTKNTEDVGEGTVVAGLISRGMAGRSDHEWGPSVLKELVRYKFTALGDASGAWVRFRMLTPVWFDSVKV